MPPSTWTRLSTGRARQLLGIVKRDRGTPIATRGAAVATFNAIKEVSEVLRNVLDAGLAPIGATCSIHDLVAQPATGMTLTLTLYVTVYLALIVAYVAVIKYMAEKPEAALESAKRAEEQGLHPAQVEGDPA